MKIYVAARFHEKERVQEIYKKLLQDGHTITQDWTLCTTQKPYSVNSADAAECVQHDIVGVEQCDVFIFITNPAIGAGSAAELGAALMSNLLRNTPHIYAVGPYVEDNIVLYHPVVKMRDSIDDVIQEIKSLDIASYKHADKEVMF